ncbi:MAG: MmcQ/YjbR family DNA-binding protein [Candidatus Obscuribacterales bacterium]|nr:MmcQ/YjbR family DNA-binding protein [Candidatus Obscuribacterales bacterium]
MRKGKVDAKLQKVSEAVRKLTMAFPETQEDHPWEHSAFKVKKKTFVFMALDADGLRLSFKLDQSLFNTLALPMCEPTGYGLGKSGWVTASFESGDNVPMSHVERWIDERFRLIAPKTMVKQLNASPAGKKSNDKTSPSKARGAKDELAAKETVKTIAKGRPR